MEKKYYEISIKRVLAARKWKVLSLVAKSQDFSKLMPSVKKYEVVSRSKNKVESLWQVDLDGIPLSWKQEVQFDYKNWTLAFAATDGDLEEMQGQWQFKQIDSQRTEVQIQIKICIGIPQVEEVIGGALASKLKKNFNAMLDSYEELIVMHQYRRISNRRISPIKGFAVMCHPYNYEHLIQYIQFFKKGAKLPSREFLSKVFEMTPSYDSYKLKSFTSKTGKETSGHFIMCPIVPDMLAVDLKSVVQKVVEGCKVAERLGLGVMALGGFTSIAGEMNNKSIRQLVNIPVTTGNTYTVALVLQGVRKAAQLMGLDLSQASVTIIGGAGDIGFGCARILAEEVKSITITGRNEKYLGDAERQLVYLNKAEIKTNRDNKKAVLNADIVIAAASSSKSIVSVDDLKSGAIVSDVGYPKNISHAESDRKDVFIFSGGICSLPSEFDFGFDVGLPSTKTLYGCYSEAIILDLEERYENFSEGKGNITKEKVDLISDLATKHGFSVAPFFWGDKLLTEKDIEELRQARTEAVLKNAR